nr:serine/threonine-protein kinase PCRK1-like [Tanacetum cinerariifolium]
MELKEWVTDVTVLRLVEHPNLAKLVGYYAEDNERGIQRLLVYENMPNGSIEHHLSSGETLSWTMRLKVARDTARALVYLHEEMDFQVLKEGLPKASGMVGYMAPEYILIGNRTSNSDIWSYGVFLYELITGSRPLDMNRPQNEQNLLEWVKPFIGSKGFRLIVNLRLKGNYSLKSAQKLSTIANKCLSKNPKSRPKMSEVLGMVNQLGFHQKQPVTTSQ